MNLLSGDGKAFLRRQKAFERLLRAHMLRHWAIVMGRNRLRLVK